MGATQNSAREPTTPVLAQRTAAAQHKAQAYLKHFFVHCVLPILSAKLLAQHLQLPAKLDHSLRGSVVSPTELPLGAAVFYRKGSGEITITSHSLALPTLCHATHKLLPLLEQGAASFSKFIPAEAFSDPCPTTASSVFPSSSFFIAPVRYRENLSSVCSVLSTNQVFC